MWNLYGVDQIGRFWRSIEIAGVFIMKRDGPRGRIILNNTNLYNNYTQVG